MKEVYLRKISFSEIEKKIMLISETYGRIGNCIEAVMNFIWQIAV
jgi:hypothetical protein